MKGFEIIECLCYHSDTSMGTFCVDSEYNTIEETIINMFISEDMHYVCDGVILPDNDYVYTYDERLRHPRKGEVGANACIEVKTKNGVIKHQIFLYIVE